LTIGPRYCDGDQAIAPLGALRSIGFTEIRARGLGS
jgi:hypothetical protein